MAKLGRCLFVCLRNDWDYFTFLLSRFFFFWTENVHYLASSSRAMEFVRWWYSDDGVCSPLVMFVYWHRCLTPVRCKQRSTVSSTEFFKVQFMWKSHCVSEWLWKLFNKDYILSSYEGCTVGFWAHVVWKRTASWHGTTKCALFGVPLRAGVIPVSVLCTCAVNGRSVAYAGRDMQNVII